MISRSVREAYGRTTAAVRAVIPSKLLVFSGQPLARRYNDLRSTLNFEIVIPDQTFIYSLRHWLKEPQVWSFSGIPLHWSTVIGKFRTNYILRHMLFHMNWNSFLSFLLTWLRKYPFEWMNDWYTKSAHVCDTHAKGFLCDFNDKKTN